MEPNELKTILDAFRELIGLTNGKLTPALASQASGLRGLFTGLSPLTAEKLQRLIPVLEEHLAQFIDSHKDWPPQLLEEIEDYLSTLIEEVEDAAQSS